MKQFKYKNYSYGKIKICINFIDKMEVKVQNNKYYWFLEILLNFVSLFLEDMLGNSIVNRLSF